MIEGFRGKVRFRISVLWGLGFRASRVCSVGKHGLYK